MATLCFYSCTGADLNNICNHAAMKAATDGNEVVTMEHIEYAIDKVTWFIVRFSMLYKLRINHWQEQFYYIFTSYILFPAFIFSIYDRCVWDLKKRELCHKKWINTQHIMRLGTLSCSTILILILLNYTRLLYYHVGHPLVW